MENNNVNELFSEISKFLNLGKDNHYTTVQSIDLDTKEGRDRYNEIVESLENNPLFKMLYSLAGGENFDKDIEILKSLPKEIEKKEKEKEKEKIKRPSEILDNVNVKLQIHKLVDEYCDKYIRPYTSDDESGKKMSNDAYAGLFEFACWIFNKN